MGGLALGLQCALHASRACALSLPFILDLRKISELQRWVSERPRCLLAHLGTGEVLRVPWSELWLGAGLSGPRPEAL